jgi:hypothetical protein
VIPGIVSVTLEEKLERVSFAPVNETGTLAAERVSLKVRISLEPFLSWPSPPVPPASWEAIAVTFGAASTLATLAKDSACVGPVVSIVSFSLRLLSLPCQLAANTGVIVYCHCPSGTFASVQVVAAIVPAQPASALCAVSPPIS